MIKKINKGLMAIFAVCIGLYPLLYFFIDRRFGLLSTKPDVLLGNILWNIGFYTHIILGGLALLIGWSQFNTSFRNKYLHWHRRIGKLYLGSVILSALGGLYIALFATGGWIAGLGFFCLGVIWLLTTLKAYMAIRNKELRAHRVAMMYSYAACFAAVTLRIWLPVLIGVTGDFFIAYKIVAWWCWIPNLGVAWYLVKLLPEHKISFQKNE